MISMLANEALAYPAQRITPRQKNDQANLRRVAARLVGGWSLLVLTE